MGFSQYSVEVHPAFKVYSTLTSVGDLSAHIYNKTEVDDLRADMDPSGERGTIFFYYSKEGMARTGLENSDYLRSIEISMFFNKVL